MKILNYVSLLFISFCLLNCSEDKGKEEPTPKPKPKKELVWADEFDYNGAPDPSKWNYEIGFVRNKEEQYYTNRPENIIVHNGYLEIKAIKEKYPNAGFKENEGKYYHNKLNIKTANYTSASINTENKYNVKYGRIEMRAKLPQGKGVWPAFWMLGANRPEVKWPRCGEIDIMEYVGKDPNFIHGSLHSWDYKTNNKVSVTRPVKIENPTSYHIYAIEWTEREINFYVDNKKYFSKNSFDNTFRKDFFILLNFALGGLWGDQMMEIDNSIFPQSYIVDYVRVYKLK